MVTGQGLRVRFLVAVVIATAVFGYLGQRWWALRGGGVLMPSPTALVLFAFMAGGVFAAGLPIRRYRRDRSRPPVDPLRALRTLILAQACAITGALVTGWYSALGLVMMPDADAASIRGRIIVAGLFALAGIGLSAVGLWVQSWCRLDRHERDPDVDPYDQPDDSDGELLRDSCVDFDAVDGRCFEATNAPQKQKAT